MKRKVVCVWGSFEENDFVLEPFEGSESEEDFFEKDIFWIEKVEKNNE